MEDGEGEVQIDGIKGVVIAEKIAGVSVQEFMKVYDCRRNIVKMNKLPANCWV